MVVTGLVLIALGVLLGLFFPVMFVAAGVGVVLLVLALLGVGRTVSRTRAS